MSNLGPQQQNISYDSLLQIPGGVTAQLQQVQDGEGRSTGLWVSSAGTNATTASSFTASVNGTAISGVVPRLISDGFGDYVSVKDFGAVGDGVTDDTAAVQAADQQARALGATLLFPGGTYMVSQLVLYTGSNWIGAGRDATTIKQIAGSNKDLIYGYNSNANWGSITPVNFANGFTLKSLTLDGNSANNTSGSGIAAFASRPIIEDVFIKNCAEYGMRTEYHDASAGLDTFAMEGYFSDIKIDTVGKHGWYNSGPHDSTIIAVIVIDAGQSAANTYDGFYLNTGATHIGCHAWTRAASVRARSALNVLGAGNNFSGGCQFEGGYTANAIIANQKNAFDSSTRFYAAWNGVNILLSGSSATVNRICGVLGDAAAGRPACVGLTFGAASGDYIASNYISITCYGQTAGNIAFTSGYTGGKNIIQINAYIASGTYSYVGTPLDSERISYYSVTGSTPTALPLLNTGYTAFGSVVPASVAQTQSKVYAVENTSPSFGVIGAAGSPTFYGLNLGGGNVQSPTSSADFDALAVFEGRGYTSSGSVVGAANILFRARNPSGSNLSGDMIFSVRNATAYVTVIAINQGGVDPNIDNTYRLGSPINRWTNAYAVQFRPGDGSPVWTSGSGSPEGVVYGPIGSMYTRTDGGAGSTLYIKESGASNTNTGWVAK